MSRILFVLLSMFVLVSCSKSTAEKIKATDEAVFISSEKIPDSYTSWTFFWKMPKIDKDAQLEYTVSVPGKKDCFHYVFKKDKIFIPGKNIRSDFDNKVLPEGPNSRVTITLKVDKGKISFPEKTNFYFVFRNEIPACLKI